MTVLSAGIVKGKGLKGSPLIVGMIGKGRALIGEVLGEVLRVFF